MQRTKPDASGNLRSRFIKGAHYIYTTLQVQYKRLFELAASLINQ